MHPVAGEGVAGIVGRESELKALTEFVTPAGSGTALVLRGSPGVGKTTLWQAGRDVARDRGMRVLSAKPNSAETSLSFAGLNTSRQIGAVLFISPRTVEMHVQGSLLKLGCRTRAEAVRRLAELGTLPPVA